VAASHVSKHPAPLCAAFPKIAAFDTAMPTIQLPTAVLFVFIDSLPKMHLSFKQCDVREIAAFQTAVSFSSFFMSRFLLNFTKFRKN
jgi:hypothetical protein